MRVISNIEFIHLEEIGQQGANSRVFRTIDPQLGSQIAVKEIQKVRMMQFNEYFREAQMLHASAHPNVVEVKFASHDTANVYIAMPFYANGSLKSVLNRKFLTVREIVKTSIEFLTGLQHIHFKNLIHYDIKPANILFDNSNRAMISDFGLAQWVNDVGVADVDAFYGKHLVPEAATSGSATIQADIFQVGMTLYRMCNGEADFQNQFRGINFQNQQERDTLIQRIQREEFPQREFHPHIPYKLKEIVKKCLKANPDQRYKSILELINDLGEVEDSLDWQYGFLNNNECWIKEENGYLTSVLIQPENNNFSVKVTKKNIQTNRLINDNQNSSTGLRDLKAARNKVFSLFKNKL